MDILTALKERDIRVTNHDKWLVWDEFLHWNVYERKFGARKTTTLISTESLEQAIETLLGRVEGR